MSTQADHLQLASLHLRYNMTVHTQENHDKGAKHLQTTFVTPTIKPYLLKLNYLQNSIAPVFSITTQLLVTLYNDSARHRPDV